MHPKYQETNLARVQIGRTLAMRCKEKRVSRETAVRWPSRDVTLLKRMVAEGRHTTEIAATLGVKPQRVQDKRLNLGISPRAAKGVVERDCLVCGEEFSSRGAHNRLCTTCRTKNYWPW